MSIITVSLYQEGVWEFDVARNFWSSMPALVTPTYWPSMLMVHGQVGFIIKTFIVDRKIKNLVSCVVNIL